MEFFAQNEILYLINEKILSFLESTKKFQNNLQICFSFYQKFQTKCQRDIILNA